MAVLLLPVALLAAAAAAADLPQRDAAAAVSDPVRPEDIVVTARRREERAQDVPIALSVVGRRQLEATDYSSLNQIQQLVPSLQIVSLNPKNTFINIRGFGSNVAVANNGIDNGVGVYIDQVYYPRVSASQIDLVDLDRIEVLRGPQGTLFGRNTTAGAISISSRAPDFKPDFTGEASFGDYGYYQLRASVSAPIVADKIAFRLSGTVTSRNGFIKDVTTGDDTQSYSNRSIRAQLLLKPMDTVSIRLIGDYSRQSLRTGSVFTGVISSYDNGTKIPNNFLDRIGRTSYVPLPIDPFALKSDADITGRARQGTFGFSGQVDADLGGATLTSITAYRKLKFDPVNDVDATALSVFTAGSQDDRQRQFSQEVRLASDGQRTVDYVVGAYYFRQVVKGYGQVGYGADAPAWFLPTLPAVLTNAALAGFHSSSYSDPRTRSYAGFAQATWHIASALSLTGGLRFTHEDKDGRFEQVQDGGADLSLLPPAFAGAAQAIRNGFSANQTFGAKRSDDSLSGTVDLSYKISRNALLYATYSRGAKSGGLNLSAIPAGVPATIAPERVDNYEVGLKSTLPRYGITTNLAAFWSEVSDYQTVIYVQVPNTVNNISYLANIPRVRSRGIEADTTWSPIHDVSLSASASYVDAVYVSYRNGQAPVESGAAIADLSGRPLAGTSRFSYTVYADAARPVGAVELYGHADWAHRSNFYTAVSDSRYSRVPAYGLLNLRLGLRRPDRRWDIALWLRNALDKHYFQALNPGAMGLITGIPGDPRTIGATLRTTL